jgi:type II secretory pathway component PulF
MAKKKKGVFEADKRMELRMRLAAKRAEMGKLESKRGSLQIEIPKADTVSRLIERVQAL